jgi:hypothetical protein
MLRTRADVGKAKLLEARPSGWATGRGTYGTSRTAEKGRVLAAHSAKKARRRKFAVRAGNKILRAVVSRRVFEQTAGDLDRASADMPGPPPEPVRLKLLKGNPGRRPLRPEPEPAIEPQCPPAPPYLSGYAAQEWEVVAPELHRLRLLTAVDLASLAAYCVAYQQWRVAVEALDKMANNDPSGLNHQGAER